MHPQPTSAHVQDQAFRDIRRAYRLRHYPDALAAARKLIGPRDHKAFVLMRAAEEAGLGLDHAQEMRDWIMLHLVPELAGERTQANLDAARSVASLPRFLPNAASIMARAASEPPVTVQDAPPAEPPLAMIRVAAGELTRMVDAAERAVLQSSAGLYQQAGKLVRLGWVDAPGGETLRVIPVDEMHLVELFGRVAAWVRFDARTRQDVPASCPRDVARAYLSRGGLEWRVPHLAGVIHAPTLRADGTVLDAPGYDDATGLFLDDGGAELGGLPSRPTKDDAEDAAGVLDALLGEFAFKGEPDKAVAVAAILTAMIRRSLPTAPLFAFTAPTAGTGKSLLVDVVATIATGQPAHGFTWSDDPHENRKQLDAALIEGKPAINLDNVRAPLGGDRLNQVLTQAAATVRVLGESRTVEVPCGAFITANGNNLAIEADLTRRVMLCSLDAGVERPEERTFNADPLAAAAGDRGRYVVAALTILRAYHLAGRPGQPRPLGSFEAWSGWVRGAVAWLGYADPAASMAAAREVDPRGAELAAVLGQWDEVVGDRRVTSAQLIAAAVCAVEFREALLAVAGVGGAINTHRLGKWLHANKGRMVGALRVEPGGKASGGYATWVLTGGRRAADVLRFPGGEVGEVGEVPPSRRLESVSPVI